MMINIPMFNRKYFELLYFRNNFIHIIIFVLVSGCGSNKSEVQKVIKAGRIIQFDVSELWNHKFKGSQAITYNMKGLGRGDVTARYLRAVVYDFKRKVLPTSLHLEEKYLSEILKRCKEKIKLPPTHKPMAKALQQTKKEYLEKIEGLDAKKGDISLQEAQEISKLRKVFYELREASQFVVETRKSGYFPKNTWCTLSVNSDFQYGQTNDQSVRFLVFHSPRRRLASESQKRDGDLCCPYQSRFYNSSNIESLLSIIEASKSPVEKIESYLPMSGGSTLVNAALKATVFSKSIVGEYLKDFDIPICKTSHNLTCTLYERRMRESSAYHLEMHQKYSDLSRALNGRQKATGLSDQSFINHTFSLSPVLRLSERLYIKGSIPLHYIRFQNDSQSHQFGLGDIELYGKGLLVDERLFKVWTSVGATAPTGTYTESQELLIKDLRLNQPIARYHAQASLGRGLWSVQSRVAIQSNQQTWWRLGSFVEFSMPLGQAPDELKWGEDLGASLAIDFYLSKLIELGMGIAYDHHFSDRLELDTSSTADSSSKDAGFWFNNSRQDVSLSFSNKYNITPKISCAITLSVPVWQKVEGIQIVERWSGVTSCGVYIK
jgi:hypothetical protein